MLVHAPSAVDGLVAAAVTPVGIDRLELAATAALFEVEVVFLVIPVDRPATTITPKDGQPNRLLLTKFFTCLAHRSSTATPLKLIQSIWTATTITTAPEIPTAEVVVVVVSLIVHSRRRSDPVRVSAQSTPNPDGRKPEEAREGQDHETDTRD